MDWTTLIAIITALGGRELINWIVNYKALARREKATAEDAEISVHEKHIEYYETRLLQRDAKVDEIYRELREEQKRYLEILGKLNALEVKIEVLTLKKCDVRGCQLRQPPSEY